MDKSVDASEFAHATMSILAILPVLPYFRFVALGLMSPKDAAAALLNDATLIGDATPHAPEIGAKISEGMRAYAGALEQAEPRKPPSFQVISGGLDRPPDGSDS